MIIVDLYSLAGFIIAILAMIVFKPKWSCTSTIVTFLLAMFFWPITAVVILIRQWEKT